ncbi:MAG: zinc ribbon domain-containing protein [Proteobacteria bacterium]|nr:zinc ribbon domain-containing protein [Pseudomonadota bacterium]
MPLLNQQQRESLEDAIKEYNYPKVTYDFRNKKEIVHSSMRQLEASIRVNLTSGDPIRVKDGLSNVLYWGHYRAGYRWDRVRDFRKKITQQKLDHVARTLQNIFETPIWTIKNIELPQFSNISFISKILMFLDPQKYVTLDRKLMKLANVEPITIFHSIKTYRTYIPCTRENEQQYQNWCGLCKNASIKYFQGQEVFAVDIERGIFCIVEKGQYNVAAQIIANI